MTSSLEGILIQRPALTSANRVFKVTFVHGIVLGKVSVTTWGIQIHRHWGPVWAPFRGPFQGLHPWGHCEHYLKCIWPVSDFVYMHMAFYSYPFERLSNYP